MIPAVRIRDLTTEDVPAMRRLVEDVLAEYGFSVQVGGIDEDLRGARERYGGGRAGFWVAEAERVIIGSVAVRPKDDATCELKRLYLAPDRRGLGLGQALYEHAEAFARSAGYERVALVSSRRFDRAHKLYERNGFVLVERLDNDWEDNLFEKVLAPLTRA